MRQLGDFDAVLQPPTPQYRIRKAGRTAAAAGAPAPRNSAAGVPARAPDARAAGADAAHRPSSKNCPAGAKRPAGRQWRMLLACRASASTYGELNEREW